jgi:hypothetical protein
VGISRPFGEAFSLPGTAASFAACAGVALAMFGVLQATEASIAAQRSAIRAQAALLAAAAIVPGWTVPCVLLAFAVAWRNSATKPRTRAASATAVSIIVALVSMRVATINATWTSCVWPADIFGSVKTLGTVVDASGPLVLALGALGAYATAVGPGLTRTRTGAVVAALAMISWLGTQSVDRVLDVPVFLAVWYLAAAGLREMHTRAPNRRAIVSALLLAVVPLLQLSRARLVEREGFSRAAPALLDHDRLSLAQIRRLLNLIPDRASVVEEDASVDLLLRAATQGRRPAKLLTIVPAARKDVATALSGGRVYAFPLGQHSLNLRGFVIDTVKDLPAESRGLATVTAQLPCVEIARAWVDLDGVGIHGRVSIVADAAPAVGPVVIYFSGENGYTPGPDGWPPKLVAGFALQMFDRSDPAHAARMEAEATAAGLNGQPVFAAPYVARLTLSRLPGGPLALPVVLGPPRARGVARLTAASADALPLTLCDAPSVRVSEF